MKIIKANKKKGLDGLTYLAGIMLPLVTIPQAYIVLVSKETEGVSLFTWSFYLFASILFAVYGGIHREKLLMMTYIPFMIVEVAIVVGLVIH